MNVLQYPFNSVNWPRCFHFPTDWISLSTIKHKLMSQICMNSSVIQRHPKYYLTDMGTSASTFPTSACREQDVHLRDRMCFICQFVIAKLRAENDDNLLSTLGQKEWMNVRHWPRWMTQSGWTSERNIAYFTAVQYWRRWSMNSGTCCSCLSDYLDMSKPKQCSTCKKDTSWWLRVSFFTVINNKEMLNK